MTLIVAVNVGSVKNINVAPSQRTDEAVGTGGLGGTALRSTLEQIGVGVIRTIAGASCLGEEERCKGECEAHVGRERGGSGDRYQGKGPIGETWEEGRWGRQGLETEEFVLRRWLYGQAKKIKQALCTWTYVSRRLSGVATWWTMERCRATASLPITGDTVPGLGWDTAPMLVQDSTFLSHKSEPHGSRRNHHNRVSRVGSGLRFSENAVTRRVTPAVTSATNVNSHSAFLRHRVTSRSAGPQLVCQRVRRAYKLQLLLN